MTLTEWRKNNDKKISMAQIAARLEVSQPTISRIEAGEQWPGRELLQRIFELTGGQVTPNDFVLDASPPPDSEQGCAA